MTGDNGTAEARPDDNVRYFSRALRRLLAVPDLRERFRQDLSRDFISEMKLSDDMVTELKQTLLEIANLTAASETPASTQGTTEESFTARTQEAGNEAKDFFELSQRQLKFGSQILLFMSLTLFTIGVAFLLLAAVHSITNPDSVEVTAVIGGLGIVQIVALFYRNPFRDVSRTISNAQQSKIIVLSYTLGLGLVGRDLSSGRMSTPYEALSRVTDEALMRFEQYTKNGATEISAQIEEAESAKP
jgi:hypothetical protein